MLDIYICEDNKKQLSLFTGYIRDALLIENLDMQIVLASSDPDEILEGMKASSNMGVFFLDIDLKSRINGLTLAQEIRKLQPRCFIIFITSHSEMGFLTFQYKVEPLDFIIKSSTEDIKRKIHDCLLNVQENYNFIESVVYGITGGVGFLLAIVLFASIRERLEFADPPKAFRGFPIALITAGLMALSFMGFSGLSVW